jgi:hypothetical protein
MGSGSSKPAEVKAPSFTPDYSTATFSASEVQRQLEAATAKAQESVEAATAATTASVTAGLTGFYKPILWLLGIAAVILLGIVLYDTFAPASWPNILFSRHNEPSSSSGPDKNQILYISYAHYGPDNTSNYKDVTQEVSSMIVGETTLPAFSVSWSNLGLTSDPYPNQASNLYIQYYVGTSTYFDDVFDAGSMTAQLPVTASGKGAPDLPATSSSVAAPPPTVASKIYNAIFGDSSGELSPSFHDATTSAIIQGKQAPLSSDDQGGYGIQWWMYVKDWNYGYGKKKSVIKRPDPTNTSVVNPHISLHPTDNSLQVSVSIFPATEGGASKSTPAPAGHSGSTDDVFVCDVPNIPLQTWFSVSVTVFGRNLDIYIDGKLVKSCFLTGVPKPAVGDIQLTPDGGFSGRICGLNHYPRMLTPGDATTFYNTGTSCRSKTESGIASKATGYSVKFGVYDTLGKEVQEYAF